MKSIRLILIGIAAFIMIVGSSSKPPAEPLRNVNNGFIFTKGVTIRGLDLDKPFVWKWNDKTQFQIPENWIARWGSYRGNYLPTSENYSNNSLNVAVRVPGRKSELYGRLLFTKISQNSTGAGSRLYRIEIPQKYIDQATGGKISVVYEKVNNRRYNGHDATWILWLSDQPIKNN